MRFFLLLETSVAAAVERPRAQHGRGGEGHAPAGRGPSGPKGRRRRRHTEQRGGWVKCGIAGWRAGAKQEVAGQKGPSQGATERQREGRRKERGEGVGQVRRRVIGKEQAGEGSTETRKLGATAGRRGARRDNEGKLSRKPPLEGGEEEAHQEAEDEAGVHLRRSGGEGGRTGVSPCLAASTMRRTRRRSRWQASSSQCSAICCSSRTWRGVWPSTSLSFFSLSGCPSSSSSATTLSTCVSEEHQEQGRAERQRRNEAQNRQRRVRCPRQQGRRGRLAGHAKEPH